MDVHRPTGLPTAISMRPRSGAPKAIGILNIVFGSALGLCGVCSGLYVLMLSALTPMLGAQNKVMQQMRDGQIAQRAAQVRQLEEQEEQAETEEEKQTIRDRRTTLEASPIAAMPAVPDMSKMYGMNDSRVIAFLVTDMLSAIILNLLLIISGVGLVALKEWGRKMAIAVAGTKIVRLLLLQVISVLVIVPIVAKQMAEAMEQMMSQMPAGPGGAPPPAMSPQIGAVYGTMLTLGAVCMLVFGSIYPAVVVWLLSRPNARLSGQALESAK